ncbi:MAG: UDP-glucose/iron transport system ATP-binding protein [Frankiaceae bacterium]|nr:UDP-glucose/iron transport system ATP-binding protein [Frankiaceae bacterium]
MYDVADPVFVLDGVEVTRGTDEDHVHPLRDISFPIAPACVTVVVGPSGAGKSTLLRLLNRMEEPSAGVVYFHGRPLPEYDVLELRRRVGLLMQRPTPFPGTVLENLRAGAQDLAEDEARALLRRVGLAEPFLDRDTADLSGGEAQRVCLARALAVRPEVLLLDEATSALDPFAANVVERVVRGLADEGLTVVMVSHDLAQARRLADDLVVVADGRVVAVGAAASVFDGDTHPVAAAYLRGVS